MENKHQNKKYKKHTSGWPSKIKFELYQGKGMEIQWEPDLTTLKGLEIFGRYIRELLNRISYFPQLIKTAL